jgi:hypothetical protein
MTFPDDRRRLHVDEYLEGPHSDPFFLAKTYYRLWRMSEIVLRTDSSTSSNTRNYCAQTGPAGEVGYLIDVHENFTSVFAAGTQLVQ